MQKGLLAGLQQSILILNILASKHLYSSVIHKEFLQKGHAFFAAENEVETKEFGTDNPLI